MRILALLVTVTLLAMALPSTGEEQTPRLPTTETWDVAGRPLGYDLLGLEPAHTGGHDGTPTMRCDGMAPAVVTCTTGTRDVAGHISHGVFLPDCVEGGPGVGCYFGTVVSELHGLESGKVRVLRKDWGWLPTGSFASTTTKSGDWPLNEPVEHLCFSYVWTRSDLPTLAPGGVGHYGCSIKVPDEA